MSLANSPQFNVSIESPVEQTSPIEGIAGLAGMLAQGISRSLSGGSGGGSGMTARDQDALLNQSLVDGLKKVQALDNAGRSAEARQLERTIGINYATLGGNLASAQAQELIRQFTGRDGSRFGFSEDEVQLQQIMQSPDFQASYAATFATHPNSTEQERTQIALGLVSTKQANAVLMQQAQFEWTSATASGFTNQILDISRTMLGGLALKGQQGEGVTPEDIQQARLQWNNYKVELMAARPQNVSAEQWKPIQDQIDAVDENLKFWSEVTSSATVDANAAFHLQKAVEQLDVGDFQKNMLKRMLGSDPSLLVDMKAIPQNELFVLLKTLAEKDTQSMNPENLRNPNLWDSTTEQEIQNLKPQEVFDALRPLTALTGLESQKLATDPVFREEWAKVATRGLTYAHELSKQGQWLSASTYQSVFNDQFMRNIDVLKQADPALYTAITNRMNSVLTTTGIALGAQMASRGRNTAFEYNMENGKFRVNPERLRVLLGEQNFNTIMAAVVSVYDGDWDRALRDNGRAFTSSVGNYLGMDETANIWASFTTRGGIDPQVRELADSMRVLRQIQERVTGGGLPTPPRLPPRQANQNINNAFENLFGSAQ